MTESPKDLVEEAQRGRSERTPWLAISGVSMAVAGFAAMLIAVALIVYFVA